MAVTMRDVARQAGVSINTVSRVVNDYGEVSDATRLRVLAAIEELGFRPNALARSLVSGKTQSVALIIPQITDPFFPEVVLGVESVARRQGYSVLLCNTNDDPQQEIDYINMLAAKQVDGVILCGSRLNEEQLSWAAAHQRIAAVTSRHPHGASVIALRGDKGLCTITSHVIELGHRRIGHVGSSIGSGSERTAGYREALLSHDMPIDEFAIAIVHRATIDTGRAAARELLQRRPDLTAVTCFNDLIAIGVMLACADLGRRVPDDVSVAGFDDIDLASLVTPALTTMRIPRFNLGQMAMELMLRVIADQGIHEESLSVDPELVLRQSCNAPRPHRPPAHNRRREEVMAAAH
jgi:LacI family transcriptional regulator